MSEKRIKTDETADPRVSAAYREMADEGAPGHLDHVVLNAARGAAQPRWNNALGWLRPAAWVATIGVCLAIVVEIWQLPVEDTGEFGPLPAETAAAPATAPTPETGRVEESARQAAEPATLGTAQKTVQGRIKELRKQSDEDDLSNQAIELQGAVVEDELPASLLRSAPAPASAEEVAAEQYCAESQTSNPNTWLECILELERQGLYEAARLERERLTEAFPPPMIR